MTGIRVPREACSAVANLNIEYEGDVVPIEQELAAAAPHIIAAYLRDLASEVNAGKALCETDCEFGNCDIPNILRWDLIDLANDLDPEQASEGGTQ